MSVPRHSRAARRLMLALAVALAIMVAASLPAGASDERGDRDWSMNGHYPANTRSQPAEREIKPRNVDGLVAKWVVTTAGDVSATPAVVGNAVFFPDWGGKLWRIDADTGAVVWSRSIAEYNGIAGSFSRTGPAVDGGLVYVGDQNGSNFMAVEARTGALRWMTRLDSHKYAIVTGSPVVVGRLVLIGTSSRENLQNVDPCCTFRSSVVALDKRSGRIVWKTYMLPDNFGQLGQFAGAGIVNPPAVDVARGLVFVGTNSHNSVPTSVTECLAAAPDGWSESCFPPGDLFSSVVALDLQSGAVRWTYRVAGTEAWRAGCDDPPPSWCANPRELVWWDILGSGANVMQVKIDRRWRTVVGIGSRTGIYRLFDAPTGRLLWAILVGPQSAIQWGTATDGERIYVPVANPSRIPYVLQPSGTPSTGGSWAALDPATGRFLWQVPVPENADGLGPPSVANGVVYVGSMARAGDQMFALDAESGAILWRFAAGASVNAGAAISRGSIYWGSGYVRGGGSAGTKFYGFSLPDDDDDDD